jgi:hypothetical protein
VDKENWRPAPLFLIKQPGGVERCDRHDYLSVACIKEGKIGQHGDSSIAPRPDFHRWKPPEHQKRGR